MSESIATQLIQGDPASASSDFARRAGHPASGILLLENPAGHVGICGLDHRGLHGAVRGVLECVFDLECSHGFGFCQGSLLVGGVSEIGNAAPSFR